MATEAALLAEKANIETELAKLTSNPKPSYTIGDVKLDWNGYYDRLMRRLSQINGELDLMPARELMVFDDVDR